MCELVGETSRGNLCVARAVDESQRAVAFWGWSTQAFNPLHESQNKFRQTQPITSPQRKQKKWAASELARHCSSSRIIYTHVRNDQIQRDNLRHAQAILELAI